jgi:hypothetical protein
LIAARRQIFSRCCCISPNLTHYRAESVAARLAAESVVVSRFCRVAPLVAPAAGIRNGAVSRCFAAVTLASDLDC